MSEPIDMGYMSLPADVQAEAEQHAAIPPDQRIVSCLFNVQSIDMGYMSLPTLRGGAVSHRGWASGDRWTYGGPQCPAEYALCPEHDRRCVQDAEHGGTSPLHYNRAGFAWSDAEAAEAKGERR